MMNDKNGKMLEVGHIVRVEGGYFNSDNGTFVVKHTAEDPSWNGTDCCLCKCSKSGKESVAKYRTAFFPITVTTNNRESRVVARKHNKENATIEIIGRVETFKVRKQGNYFGREEIQYEIVNTAELEELKTNRNIKVDVVETFGGAL